MSLIGLDSSTSGKQAAGTGTNGAEPNGPEARQLRRPLVASSFSSPSASRPGRGKGDAEHLVQSIRRQIPAVAVATGKRFERQLEHILQNGDADHRTVLLTRLEKHVSSAASERSAQPAAAFPKARPSAPLFNVSYAGVSAQVPETQKLQILGIRLKLLKVQSPIAAKYQVLLRDVIASDDPAKRAGLLTQMNRHLDEHLGS